MTSRAPEIVFVFPPAHGNVGAFKHHLGVAYLRAALAKQGLSSTQYVNLNPGTVDEVAGDILRHKPRAAGFTVYDANFSLAIALAQAIKQRDPSVQVIFGGPSASFCYAQILQIHSVVDACVLGEAEETGAGIFEKLLAGRLGDEATPGVAFRRDGAVFAGGFPPLVGTASPALPAGAMLDATPSPYLSGILTEGRSGILSGRGCTHHCQYCCFAALGRKRLRLHSVERVLAELEFIAEHQKRSGEHYVVPVHDDAFTLLASRAKEICQAIAGKNLGLVLSCITRADAIDEELLRMMREAGFVSLAFGLESAVPHVLRATGKVRPPDWADPDLGPEREFVERVRTSVVAAKKHGFNVGVSIILGLPAETAEDGAATLRFVKSLPIDYYMHNFLWVFPGTPLWETRERYGIGCTTNSMGLATTTDYAYDLTKLRPRPKCSLEQDARIVRLLAADMLYSCAAAPAVDGGTSAAVLNAGELSSQTAEWLSRVLDIGGLLLQVYPPMTRTEQPRRLYYDRRTFSEHLIPARHHMQVLPRVDKHGGERWMVACSGVDLYCTHKPELVTIRAWDGPAPLTGWLQGLPSEYTICEASECLRQPEELMKWLNGAEGDDIGARMRRMPVPPSLKYPGRWIRGQAPCLSLTRVEIDGEGSIRCCRHGEPIGTVGDSREAMLARLAGMAAEIERRRGCAQCPNKHCPRCPFPGMDDGTYCGIMTAQKQALELINWAYLYSRVLSVIAVQRDRLGGD